ncbi:sporulation histidine kinase inhibitor Sda [Neobacillus vireti]
MEKLSIEELIEIYNDAIRLDICKDFILLLSEEIKKRYF